MLLNIADHSNNCPPAWTCSKSGVDLLSDWVFGWPIFAGLENYSEARGTWTGTSTLPVARDAIRAH